MSITQERALELVQERSVRIRQERDRTLGVEAEKRCEDIDETIEKKASEGKLCTIVETHYNPKMEKDELDIVHKIRNSLTERNFKTSLNVEKHSNKISLTIDWSGAHSDDDK